MATLETHEDTPYPWQQRGSLPQSVIDELGRTLGTDEEAPAGLFLQQEAFTAWARDRGAIIERNSITGRKLGGGVEHEVIEDLERQRVIKITHAGQYGCIGCTRWGKVELVQAKPLEYLARLAHINYMFKDRCLVLGAILHSSGPRIVISQPLMRGEAAEPAAVIAWMRSLGFVPVGRKTYWNAAEGIAIFDAHPGNVLRIPDGRLCPIDIVPCVADAQMISFLNKRVKTWKPKH